MRPLLAIHARRQNGLVTRTQALAAGYSSEEIRSLVRHSGPWKVVRRGVYTTHELWDAADDRRGKPLLRALAGHLAMNRAHVMSHDSAALVQGLPMLRPRRELIHITRPGVTGTRTEHGIKHHLAPYVGEDVVCVNGVECLDLARTAVDLGREHGYLAGLVACDAARQRGITLGKLREVVEGMRHWPHVIRARAAVEDSDPGAESVGESLAREFVASLGLGEVTTQFPVVVDGHVHFADLRVGRHLIEFDGRTKYQRRSDGGLADRSAEEVVWAERHRQTRICGVGYGMSRLIWDDLWGRNREAAAERLLREYAVTESRFGTALPADHRPVTRAAYRRSA